jgi:hypothetical protein
VTEPSLGLDLAPPSATRRLADEILSRISTAGARG